METVTISPKYQVVIPRKIRQSMRLKPGQKVQMIQYKGRVELIPLNPIKDLQGFVRGINIKFERDSDRL